MKQKKIIILTFLLILVVSLNGCVSNEKITESAAKDLPIEVKAPLSDLSDTDKFVLINAEVSCELLSNEITGVNDIASLAEILKEKTKNHDISFEKYQGLNAEYELNDNVQLMILEKMKNICPDVFK